MQDNPFESPQSQSTRHLRAGPYSAALATSVVLCAGIWLYRYTIILAAQKWEKSGVELSDLQVLVVLINKRYVIPYWYWFVIAAIVLPFLAAMLREPPKRKVT